MNGLRCVRAVTRMLQTFHNWQVEAMVCVVNPSIQIWRADTESRHEMSDRHPGAFRMGWLVVGSS